MTSYNIYQYSTCQMLASERLAKCWANVAASSSEFHLESFPSLESPNADGSSQLRSSDLKLCTSSRNVAGRVLNKDPLIRDVSQFQVVYPNCNRLLSVNAEEYTTKKPQFGSPSGPWIYCKTQTIQTWLDHERFVHSMFTQTCHNHTLISNTEHLWES